MQPMGRGVEETASHLSAQGPEACRTPGSFISRAVAAGDGQHAHAVLGGKLCWQDLLGGEPLDGQHPRGVQPVLGQQIVEDAPGWPRPVADGLARRSAMDWMESPLLQDVEHPRVFTAST